MTDEKNTSMDQIEFMKRMKAIASDLWGGVMPSYPAEEAPAAEKKEEPASQETAVKKPGMDAIWKTADETVDWTDALAHSTPTDGLTAPRIWAFYHKHAQKVLAGDLNAYTGKEETVFYSSVLKQHLPKAIDLLIDITLNSTFLQEEMNKPNKSALDDETSKTFKGTAIINDDMLITSLLLE